MDSRFYSEIGAAVKYAEENGFAIYKENSSTGEYHPIIWNMSLDVAQYHKKYGEAINE